MSLSESPQLSPVIGLKRREHYDGLRKALGKMVEAATIPVERFFLALPPNGSSTLEKVPFNPETEQQKKFVCIENELDSNEWGYSLDMGYEAIETVLLSNNGSAVKKLVELQRKEQGIVSPTVPDIKGIRIINIQDGVEHYIYKIEVYTTDGEYEFVATVARDEIMNTGVERDYDDNKELRTHEAQFTATTGRPSPLINRYARFKNPRGIYPSMYIAPYLRGAAEFNLVWHHNPPPGLEMFTPRIGVNNEVNQGATTGLHSDGQTDIIMGAITDTLLGFAAITNRSFVTFINSGDFLFDPTTQQIKWHTMRNPDYEYRVLKNTQAGPARDLLTRPELRQTPYIGLHMQILACLMQREHMAFAGKNTQGYTYTPQDMSDSLRRLQLGDAETLRMRAFLSRHQDTIIDAISQRNPQENPWLGRLLMVRQGLGVSNIYR